MKKQFLLVLACVLMTATQLLSQGVYYVKTSGSDVNDGLTWETALSSIQHAINQSKDNANGYEVWVAEGTYAPTECLSDYFGLQTADVYKSFVMYSGVNVYGGFAGTETTKEIGVTDGRELASDNPWDFAHPTILDGSSTNSYHVVWYGSNGFEPYTHQINELVSITFQIPKNLEQKAILDGFSVTGGFANMDIRLENNDNSKRNYCHVAGGGIALVGNGEVTNCKTYSNKAKYSGAGVTMFAGAEIHNTLIDQNTCIGVNFFDTGVFGFGARDYWLTNGAGVGSIGKESAVNIIDNCIISNNLGVSNDNYPDSPSATNNKYNEGGGAYLLYTTMTNTLISGNQIANNPSPYSNSAAASCGAGVFLYARGTVDNCEIADNGYTGDAQNAAGIFIADYAQTATGYDDLVLSNSYIHSNRAGGAVGVDALYSTIQNCIVANNIGFGIYGYGNCRRNQTINSLVYNNSSTGWGHSTSANNKNNTLINSTIVRNGIGISIGNTNAHSIYNTVVWGNNSNPANYANTDVQYSAFSFVPPAGTGNIQISTVNEDGPDFISPTLNHGINVSGWEDADWHIGANSELINAGNYSLVSSLTTFDIEGELRKRGLQTDIGAYESKFGGPEIEFSEVYSEYTTIETIEVTAEVYSNGLIDQLCGVGYALYKDGVIIDDLADYGTVTYKVREIGDSYYTGAIAEGLGMIQVAVGEQNIGAFTLGMFDNYCVNRNRPIDFTANFTVPGVYKMVSTIYTCSNVGIPTATNFNAEFCDGLVHYDMIATTCEDPIELSSEEVTITVVLEVGLTGNIANTISINPNPTSGMINIVGQNIDNITIFDNIGKEIISTKNTNIDISQYPAGMYFVKILADNQIITKKLIKQ